MASAADPLAGLRPLHTPPSVSWWPPAPGWWLMAGLVLAAVVLVVLYFHRTRLRRAALQELAVLAGSGQGGNALLVPLAALLKRYALACYPSGEIAALTGDKWLHFLDAHGGNGAFATGCGRALGGDLFRDGSDVDADALIGLVRRWIKVNRRRR